MPEDRDDHRALTVRIGARRITLVFNGESDCMMPFYQAVYREFLVHEVQGMHRLDVCPVPRSTHELVGPFQYPEGHHEYALTRQQFADWMRRNRKWIGTIPFSDSIIAVRSTNGLLVYAPDKRSSTLYVPQKDPYPYRSLYRLFWIYFAQVLGEQGACFLHAACLEKDGQGFMFIGGTGTGKSTLARLARNHSALGDEAPVISGADIAPRVYPSPYHQMDPAYPFRENRVFSGLPVQRLYFIIRDEKTFVEPVSRTDAVAMIMARYILFFFFVSAEARVKIFDLFHGTCRKLPIGCLHFAKNTDVWKVIPRITRED